MHSTKNRILLLLIWPSGLKNGVGRRDRICFFLYLLVFHKRDFLFFTSEGVVRSNLREQKKIHGSQRFLKHAVIKQDTKKRITKKIPPPSANKKEMAEVRSRRYDRVSRSPLSPSMSKLQVDPQTPRSSSPSPSPSPSPVTSGVKRSSARSFHAFVSWDLIERR